MMSNSARYLIRLDDACPTMRQEPWARLESLFDELNIRPLVGVIPDNRDPAIKFAPPDPAFWKRMRHWQTKGWELVLHGLHHLHHTIPLSSQPLLPLADKSEFVGLPLEKQARILTKGVEIFSNEGIVPRAFMAPSHTFDEITIQALKDATSIRVIADGHALRPYTTDGFTWLPQQIWRYYDMPFGIWCICLHPNSMTEKTMQLLSLNLRRNAHKFIDVNTALSLARPHSLLDRGFSKLYGAALMIKRTGRGIPG